MKGFEAAHAASERALDWCTWAVHLCVRKGQNVCRTGPGGPLPTREQLPEEQGHGEALKASCGAENASRVCFVTDCAPGR